MEEISRSDYLTWEKTAFPKAVKASKPMRELPGLQVRAYARLV